MLGLISEKDHNSQIEMLQQQIIETKNFYYTKSLFGDIYRALNIMDKTCNFYKEEDEANRELTTCLNLCGHVANYHQQLDNGRTVDLFVDDFALVEGKLDPNLAEIDRLIGQVLDYFDYPYFIYIVVYGMIDDVSVQRIQTRLINVHPEKVDLIYLSNPNRTRN